MPAHSELFGGQVADLVGQRPFADPGPDQAAPDDLVEERLGPALRVEQPLSPDGLGIVGGDVHPGGTAGGQGDRDPGVVVDLVAVGGGEFVVVEFQTGTGHHVVGRAGAQDGVVVQAAGGQHVRIGDGDLVDPKPGQRVVRAGHRAAEDGRLHTGIAQRAVAEQQMHSVSLSAAALTRQVVVRKVC